VEVISTFGIPLLIASDTSPPSHFVQKVSARLNTKLFHPQESMSKIEKKQIGKEIDDPHIRDSYSAAIKAYRKYQNRLRQIDASDYPNKEELKRKVLIGQRVSP
jgi:predicted RNase H-like nuclease (RuvC/YqgF family)